jgi:hypothetical protein
VEKLQFRVGTFNLNNLALPDRPFNHGERYSSEEYQQKLRWTAQQLDRMMTDLVGFQEVFHQLEFRQIGSSCTVKSAQSLEPREMSQRSTDGAPKRWTELETWAWNSSF